MSGAGAIILLLLCVFLAWRGKPLLILLPSSTGQKNKLWWKIWCRYRERKKGHNNKMPRSIRLVCQSRRSRLAVRLETVHCFETWSWRFAVRFRGSRLAVSPLGGGTFLGGEVYIKRSGEYYVLQWTGVRVTQENRAGRRSQRGLVRCLPTFLRKYIAQSKPGVAGWDLDTRLTISHVKNW